MPSPDLLVNSRRSRTVLGGALSVVLLALLAEPAGAHTALRESAPADGSTAVAVDSIDLWFTEPIEVAASHLWISDAAGYLELATPTNLGGDRTSLTVPLPALGDGDYEVTWHVVAVDGTPAQGAFSFVLGGQTAPTAPAMTVDPAADYPPDTSLAIPLDSISGVSAPPAGSTHDHGPGDVTRGLARGVLDTAVAVLLGGLAFIAVVWPRGGGVFRARQLLVGAAGVAAIASFELSAFQLARVTGSSTFAALTPTEQWAALDFRFGRVAAARLLLLVGSLVAITALTRRANRPAPSRRWLLGAAALALGLAETVVMLGHASSATSLGGLARLTHVLGISAWVGGLVMLVAVVLPRRRVDELVVVLPRFSTFATGAIGVLMVGGTVMAVDLLGSVHALVDTGYGRVLLAKLVLVGLLLIAASGSRAHVRSSLRSSEVLDGRALNAAALPLGRHRGRPHGWRLGRHRGARRPGSPGMTLLHLPTKQGRSS